MSYDDWNAKPVLTTVTSTGFPISKVPFPAVTFCTQGKISTYFFASILRQYFEFMGTDVKKVLGKNLTYLEIAQFHELNMGFAVKFLFFCNSNS